MRQLWLRIFVGMLLANAIAAGGVVMTFQSQLEGRRERIRTRDGAAIAHFGRSAAAALTDAGDRAASESLLQAYDITGIRLALLDSQGEVVAGTLDGPTASEIAARATDHPVGEPLALDRSDWQAVRLDNGLLVAGAPEPRPDMLGLSPPVMQLLVVGLLSAILSLLLARWVSGPLRALRGASERLPAVGGAVRVTPSISPLADADAVALASEFDRMAERVEELLAARERLLRDVSHELRSPLARLTVALELARETAGAEAEPFLDRIHKESERLNELIALVLTMAKLEQVPELTHVDEVPVDLLVREICGDAAFEAESMGRAVRVTHSEPVLVRGNEEILRQAIENVVRNAVRWTPEGSAVEVSVAREVDSPHGEGAWATIQVRDHGPGVPEEALDEIFRPFTRVQTARERTAGGAGIGLAITARALRLHKGHARAQNGAEGGLCVTLSLPLGTTA